MELINELKREEGFRDRVYQCSEGVDTIGYGFNVKYLSKDELDLNVIKEIKEILSTGNPEAQND